MKIASLHVETTWAHINLNFDRPSPIAITSDKMELTKLIYVAMQVSVTGASSVPDAEATYPITSVRLTVKASSNTEAGSLVLDPYTGMFIGEKYRHLNERMRCNEFRDYLRAVVPYGETCCFKTKAEIEEAILLLSNSSIGVELVSLLTNQRRESLRCAIQICDWLAGHSPLLLIDLTDYPTLTEADRCRYSDLIVKGTAKPESMLFGNMATIRNWFHNTACGLSVLKVKLFQGRDHTNEAK